MESERFRLIAAKAEKGEYDFEEIDERMDHEREAVEQMPMPEPKTETELKDWQEPEKLLQGPSQYSVDSWRGVYMLVHELIHQRQAELNPSAFPVLTSSELDSIDSNTINRSELYNLLLDSHKAHTRAQKKDSLFDPVIEGMAVLGAFYVMGKFVEDLTASGEKDIADKVRVVRKTQIKREMIEPKRKARAGESNPYGIDYAEGMGIMRKLYKKFGLENIPRILASVDLISCRQITKDSPQYKQIMENPTLLPGLRPHE